jgi:tRNA (cytidine/uridine-2'-O-)-methyltransferase
MRLSANTGVTLHLIEPLGFEMDDARLRRAGMDYLERATVHRHANLDSWFATVQPTRVFGLAKAGLTRYDSVAFRSGDAFLFGPESVGLPEDVLVDTRLETLLTIPMRPDVRSLNLSNSVAVVVYEAWRQHGFPGAEDSSRTS